MRVELDEDAIHRHLANDDAIRRQMEENMDAALNYWRANARRDTGYMADSAYGVIIDGSDGEMEAFLEFPAPYTEYQEYGTRYIQGMHLTQDLLRILAGGF